MEEIDELKCPICKEAFNSENRIPRLLFNCGHTICHSCINKMIADLNKEKDKSADTTTENVFKCPEDDIAYEGITKADTFPKNITLVKLISKAEEVRTSRALFIPTSPNHLTISNSNSNNPEYSKHPFPSSKNRLSTNFEFKSPRNMKSTNAVNADTPTIHLISNDTSNNTQTNNTNNQILNNIRSSIKRSHTLNINDVQVINNESSTSPFPTTPTTQSVSDPSHTMVNPVKYCSTHPNRPLEIICLEHKIKLCTNCALFGEHKNHKIVNEEDFIKEIEVKAEILIELFEMVDNNIISFRHGDRDGHNMDQYEELMIKNEEKKVFLIKQIHTFTEELISNLKAREAKLIEDVNSKFGKIQNKIISLREIPSDLLAKSEEWKSRVQVKLDKLNEITETSNLNEEFGKLIDMNITDQDMITNAENIINEFDKIKSFPLDSIDKMIDSNNIDINYETANTLISTAMIFINNESEIDADEILTLDDEDKKRIEKVGAKFENVLTDTNTAYTNTNYNTDVNTNYNTDTATAQSGSKFNTRNASEVNLNLMGNINVSAVNPTNNNVTTNASNFNDNNSFLTISDDSTIIKLNNYNTVSNVDKKINNTNNTDKTNNSVTNVNNNVSTNVNNFKTVTVKNTGVNNTSSHNSPRIANRKISGGGSAGTNTGGNTPSNYNPTTSRQVNVIKLPNKKDTSKSPVRDQYEKDKIVFIKSQFKNESANFTGYGK